MPTVKDGPKGTSFKPLGIGGKPALSGSRLRAAGASRGMAAAVKHAPSGTCVCRGMPFRVGRVLVIKDGPVSVDTRPFKTEWLTFMHASDLAEAKPNRDGLFSAVQGYAAEFGEHLADYVIVYADGRERRAAVRQGHQIGPYPGRTWQDRCTQCVPHLKPRPVPACHEQATSEWYRSQTRVLLRDKGPWTNWLWAWKNPRPDKRIVGFRFEPSGRSVVVLSAISTGKATSNPLRWRSRRKVILRLGRGEKFLPEIDEAGLLRQIQLDMGQVISARPRFLYPNASWSRTYGGQIPEVSARELIVEYTAHPDASFHLRRGKRVPVSRAESRKGPAPLQPVKRASQRVLIKVVQKGSRKPVAVKLHLHGESGEYLAPTDRHRLPNPVTFEDYSADILSEGLHYCTYIPGETVVDLPLGRVYLEVSKGFEIRPLRRALKVTRATREVLLEIERVLDWRERGWVNADTHVHFVSPSTALLEGAGEGVNVVNLLATQLGELMTNVGDFDGRTVHGAREFGGDGEHLVRVGTENRQYAFGHISLLGYGGRIITPLTTGGPHESALGDPVDCLVTEWARRCREQGGLVIVPHMPARLENALTLVSGEADAAEMSSGNNWHCDGIDPYSLSDWFRFLNAGYFVPIVGGTDKMCAKTAIGTMRTYARVPADEEFTYGNWMRAVRRGNTFATCGPLLEFEVEGKAPGNRIKMKRGGGTVEVGYRLASVTMPMAKVELIVNGEVRDGCSVDPEEDSGSWSVKLERSSWLALLVRGGHPDRPEVIAAHSSPVMVEVAGTEFYSAADALTILGQIEGALAYLDTIGTRAETARYKRMRMTLTAAHRELHNRMHRMGRNHQHSQGRDHAEHEG